MFAKMLGLRDGTDLTVPFQVNFAALNSTYEVDTPLCSSKQLAAFYKSRAKYEKAANPPRKITGVARSALAPISGSPSTSLQQVNT